MARDPYKYFRAEGRELIDQIGKALLELERDDGRGDALSRLLRHAHTLKGAARVVRLPDIANGAHAMEDVLMQFREAAGPVAHAEIDKVLRHVDDIAARIAALPAGDGETPSKPAAAAEAPATPSLPDVRDMAVRNVRTDLAEIDALLEGLGEAHGQVPALDGIVAAAEKAGRVCDMIAAQMAALNRDQAAVRAFAATQDLRGHLAQIRQQVGEVQERLVRELRQVRDTAEQLRLLPTDVMFGPCERIARDAARALGKRAAFEGSGGQIRLDASVVNTIQDALLQIVRNAVAHGIEPEAARLAAGKPGKGRVRIEVTRGARQVTFSCSDDGAGIDLEALKKAATRSGATASELSGLSGGGLMELMLRGGISTASTVSEIAGRGIGMDIVREAMASLGGKVAVRSTPGKGTTFDLTVPVSLSSVEALAAEVGGARVTIPSNAVEATVRLQRGELHHTPAGETIVHGGQALPFAMLDHYLTQGRLRQANQGAVSAIVLSGRRGKAAVGVDRLLGVSDVVLRGLPELAAASAFVAGASLDIDSSPVLMLDADQLIEMVLKGERAPVDTPATPGRILVIDDSLTTRMLEKSILESAGYSVDTVNSAEEGLEQLTQAEYALVLVDVEMPGMDGIGFVETIRRDPALQHLPAILVTSLSSPEHKRRGEMAGAQGYVVKGEFDQTALLEHIRALGVHP